MNAFNVEMKWRKKKKIELLSKYKALQIGYCFFTFLSSDWFFMRFMSHRHYFIFFFFLCCTFLLLYFFCNVEEPSRIISIWCSTVEKSGAFISFTVWLFYIQVLNNKKDFIVYLLTGSNVINIYRLFEVKGIKKWVYFGDSFGNF